MADNFIRDVNKNDAYNNLRLLNLDDAQVMGIPHIFFSTPMLNLTEPNIAQDSFLYNMYFFHPSWLKQLSYGSGEIQTTSPFIKMFYNSATSFNTKDATSKTVEVGETYYGYRLTLPSSNVDSIVGDELTIEFLDWQGLPVLNMLNAWFVYHNKVRRGQLVPDRTFIKSRMLDYVSSIYYIVTAMDNSTILYYAKYTGVVPISVPFSAFSTTYTNHDILKYSVNFVYSFKEDLTPDIITDFNKTANGRGMTLENYYAAADANGGYIYDTGNLPVEYYKCPNNDALTPYEQTGYTRVKIVHGSYVPDGATKLQQSPDYRLVFTN